MSRISQLSDRLRDDIVERALCVGDRYLTAVEAGAMLGVSATTANRALGRLAAEGVLERGRRRGAVLRRLPGERPAQALARVHVWLPGGLFLPLQGVLGAFQHGVRQAAPRCEVVYRFSTPRESEAEARQWLGGIDPRCEGVAVLLGRAGQQKLLAASPVPALAWGSVYPGVEGLPWIDADWRINGEMLAAHLVKTGRWPAALLMHSCWGYGDNLMVEGMAAASRGSRAPCWHPAVRSVEDSEAAVFEGVRELFSTGVPPRSCVLRSAFMLAPARAAFRELGLASRVAVAVADYAAHPKDMAGVLHFRPVESLADQGTAAVGMLAAQLRGRPEGWRPHIVKTALHVSGEQELW